MSILRLASSFHIFFVDSLNSCYSTNPSMFLARKLGGHLRSTARLSVTRVPEPQETARLHTNKYTLQHVLKQEVPGTSLGYFTGKPAGTGANAVYR